MKIALGSDHGGYALKCDIIKLLEKLGHEYKDFGCYSTESCDYPDFGEAAARAVASGEYDRGIELNTNRGHTPLPDEKWLRMYRELGGEIVTLGTDAHSPGAVGCAVREGQALLRACGFTRFCTFRRGTPVWHEL